MKKVELIEIKFTYCDFCGEKITDNSYAVIDIETEKEKHFHSYSKVCIEDYNNKEKENKLAR